MLPWRMLCAGLVALGLTAPTVQAGGTSEAKPSHSHEHASPHGGLVETVGARQLELLFEKESGELTLYVLGSRKLTAQPISAVPFRCRSWIEVRLRFAGRAEPERFNFSFDGAAD